MYILQNSLLFEIKINNEKVVLNNFHTSKFLFDDENIIVIVLIFMKLFMRLKYVTCLVFVALSVAYY